MTYPFCRLCTIQAHLKQHKSCFFALPSSIMQFICNLAITEHLERSITRLTTLITLDMIWNLGQSTYHTFQHFMILILNWYVNFNLHKKNCTFCTDFFVNLFYIALLKIVWEQIFYFHPILRRKCDFKRDPLRK